jgi:hypothetical protein
MKQRFAYLAFFAFSSAATAATSDTLTLSGTIGATVSVSVAADPNASSLDLETTQSDLLVGVVTENSNAANGYKIRARSANASQIKHSTASDNVPYTMKYAGGGAITLTVSDQDVKTQSTGGSYSGVTSNVTVSYTGASAGTLTAGTYSDTITFTIEAL